MIYYLITAVFILSIAIASGSIVIASHLKISYKSDFFSSLIFFLAFYFTFGFYTLWGQIIMESIIFTYVTEELMGKITEIMVLLGSPFLILASLMFVKFTYEISGRKISNLFIFWYLLINIILISGLGFITIRFQNLSTLLAVRYYFIALCFLFTGSGAYFFLFPGKSKQSLRHIDLIKLSLGLVSIMLIQNALLLVYDRNIYIALLFVFSFFVYGGITPLYIKYAADLSPLIPSNELSQSFEDFCSRYGISPRETEIIHEICKGLSNQEIANRLFISLQTVKDHTHRIYNKTDCSSRSQLMRMVNESS